MLFVSYSSEDYELAKRLTERLSRSGYEYWIDRERLKTGDKWGIELENALRQATAVVVLLTSQATKPDSFVRRELQFARYWLHKPIYALVPELIAAEDMPMDVADLQQISCIDDFDSGINRLIFSIGPLEHGDCIIDVPPELVSRLHLKDIDYAIMSRFPLTSKIYVRGEITKGNSGSKVLSVNVSFRNSDKPPSPHFLKINHAKDDTPRKRFEMAYKTKIKSFMPVLSDVTPWDKQHKLIGLLYGLGEARFGNISLDELVDKNFVQARAVIQNVCDALVVWNDDGKHHKNLSPRELLEHAICDSLDADSRYSYLDKSADTSIFRRCADALGLNESHKSIDFETRNLPNPLAYLVYDNLWEREYENLNIIYPSGNIHGDLHTRNIQAYKARDGKSLGISFIDFDTYDPDNLIFVDFAFLEISVIIRLFGLDKENRQQENRHDLERLSEYMAQNLELDEHDIPDLNVLSVGAWHLLLPLRKAVSRIAEYNRKEYEMAFWIARIAAALKLVRKKRCSHQERVLALLIAADSIEHLIKHYDLRKARGSAISLTWSPK